MKEQFVTYEIAVSLKELGFDETCIAVFLSKDNFKIEHGLLNYPKELFGDFIKAPLWQQVVDWFDQTYNLLIVVKYDKIYGYQFDVRSKRNKPAYRCAVTYQRLYDAREYAILKAIEIINND